MPEDAAVMFAAGLVPSVPTPPAPDWKTTYWKVTAVEFETRLAIELPPGVPASGDVSCAWSTVIGAVTPVTVSAIPEAGASVKSSSMRCQPFAQS